MTDTFLLLSAGRGRLPKEYGSKSLMLYKGKSLLSHQIKVIKEFAPNSQILCVVGFESNKIIQSNPKCQIIFNDDYESFQGTSIYKGFMELDLTNLWIIHGDLLFSKQALKIPDRLKPYIMYETKGMMHKTKVGISNDKDRLINLEFGLSPKWTQISYVPKYHLDKFYDSISLKKNTYQILNDFNQKVEVYCYENKKASVYEVDSPKDIA